MNYGPPYMNSNYFKCKQAPYVQVQLVLLSPQIAYIVCYISLTLTHEFRGNPAICVVLSPVWLQYIRRG